MCNRKWHCYGFQTISQLHYIEFTYYSTRLAIKMPRLNEAQRHEAIGMLRAMPVIDVANHFNCHRATIHKLKSRYQTTGHVGDLPRTGRPRVTTDAEDRRIRISHLRNRFKTASNTAREWQRNVSRQTVSRRLKDYGLFCRRPAREKQIDGQA